jgi:SAM-dependent methyltransferase
VIGCNLAEGIPLPNATYKIVYHSHLLEHFPKNRSGHLIGECHRVLSPGGIIRIAVPDLESITIAYLEALGRALCEEDGWKENYEWMMLELYDQAVRNKSGGEMAKYLLKDHVVNEEFVFNRCGVEVRNLRKIACQRHSAGGELLPESRGAAGLSVIVKNLVARILGMRVHLRERFLKKILGAEYAALSIGRFRVSGEVHQWMYDRYSLRCMLELYGFEGIVQRSAVESYIPNWTSYNLDTEPDGSVYKPDSLYMEAIKP